MDKKEFLLQQKAEAEKNVAQLQNQQKIILNKQRDLERRARKHRLIQRGAIFESIFPCFKTNEDNEAVQTFLIALSRLPGVTEITPKTPETGDEG